MSQIKETRVGWPERSLNTHQSLLLRFYSVLFLMKPKWHVIMKTHKNTRGKNLTKGDSALDFESACLFKAVIKQAISSQHPTPRLRIRFLCIKTTFTELIKIM